MPQRHEGTKHEDIERPQSHKARRHLKGHKATKALSSKYALSLGVLVAEIFTSPKARRHEDTKIGNITLCLEMVFKIAAKDRKNFILCVLVSLWQKICGRRLSPEPFYAVLDERNVKIYQESKTKPCQFQMADDLSCPNRIDLFDGF